MSILQVPVKCAKWFGLVLLGLLITLALVAVVAVTSPNPREEGATGYPQTR